MPITLLPEDGTGVATANTFATLDQAKAYAAARGIALNGNDEALKAFLVKATDFLRSLSFQGTKTYPGQDYLPWPRKNLLLDAELFPEDAVPNDIVNAQCQLVVEQSNGIVLSESKSGPSIKSETVGPIQTVYVGTSRGAPPSMPIVDALLDGWIVQTSGLRAGRG